MNQVTLMAQGLEREMEQNSVLRGKAVSSAQRLGMIRKLERVHDVGNVPY
ncbi:MAG: hypothetical protein WCF90_07540 [Methanomicrobiales archaeon]